MAAETTTLESMVTQSVRGAAGELAALVVREDLDAMCDRLSRELRQLSGRSLLITGGAGFLGYYLVQVPLWWNRRHQGTASPIRLTVCDTFFRGVPDWLLKRADGLVLRVVEHDISTPFPPEVADFDYVIHAASIASPTYYREHPIETMDANVKGVRSLLEFCRRRVDADQAVTGFLFFSSSEIYGDPDPSNIPTSETYRGNVSCTGPRACYDESKRFGETLCVNFARVHDIPVKIVRPFNNYGPGLRLEDRRVIPDFARDILEGRDVVLLSDGSPTRTFCYVADAVVGYYRALLVGRQGEPYNIGVETPEISMVELAERMVTIGRELFGYRNKVVRRTSDDPAYLIDNPTRRRPSIAKARIELGYEPKTELDAGLRRSLLWYRGQQAVGDL